MILVQMTMVKPVVLVSSIDKLNPYRFCFIKEGGSINSRVNIISIHD